ncbi:hypothetical protein NLG97_g10383 [Lecanicillium saksenae]|uniref:Uncharacterized protein n=1 Tax=Lecanicillium saksenae TaxID=468837 RepID=A0ACC1QET1_9HYPO|nr:hypothetical protein NLG97_g10383 [Lecanicillium saksenae]
MNNRCKYQTERMSPFDLIANDLFIVKRGLEVRWTLEDAAPRIFDHGVLHGVRYAEAAAANMPIDVFSEEVCPYQITDFAPTSGDNGSPVFSVIFYSFADGDAVGLCLYAHHRIMDGFGLVSVARLWADTVNNLDASTGTPSGFCSAVGRNARLDAALSRVSSGNSLVDNVEDLWARHPAYSKIPPTAPPSDMSNFTSATMLLSVDKINAVKDRLQPYLGAARPSTNSVACALICSP